MPHQPHTVTDILTHLKRAATKEEAAVDDLMDAIGTRSYGPFLLIPALIELSPVGSIPGIPTLLALTIIFFAAQMLAAREHIWIPGILGRRKIPSKHIRKATKTMQPIARWLDNWFHGRLPTLTKPPFTNVAAVGCILLALTVPALEIFPFASSIPMAAIAMVGLALLVHDGLLMLLALTFILFAATAALGFATVT